MTDWQALAECRVKAHRQVLFNCDDEPMLQQLLNGMPRRAVVLWALDMAEDAVEQLSVRHPEESRPREALMQTRRWASGKIRMPEARRAILDCHACAKAAGDAADAARYHAVGQACAVVHTAGHALGYAMYALTAIVREHGTEECAELLAACYRHMTERALWWAAHAEDEERDWAAFL